MIENLCCPAASPCEFMQIRLIHSFGFVTLAGATNHAPPLDHPGGRGSASDRLRITLIKILARICITASVSNGIFSGSEGREEKSRQRVVPKCEPTEVEEGWEE